MDNVTSPIAHPFSTARGIVGAVVAALLVVAIGVTIPLQVASLKKEKAEATVVPPEVEVHRPPEYGVASWYGDHEAGRLTASGVVFRPEAMTAAHRWLPLGTKVRVTRLGTKHSTVVTINDRGPYIGGRIIDLSPAAAEKLSMVDKGLARVRVDVITEPSPAEQMVKRAIRKAKKSPRPEEMAEQPPKQKQAVSAKAKREERRRESQAEAEQQAEASPPESAPDAGPDSADMTPVMPAGAKAIAPKPADTAPLATPSTDTASAPLAVPDSMMHFP